MRRDIDAAGLRRPIARAAWIAVAGMLSSLVAVSPASSTPLAESGDVQRATLSNGLRVVVVRTSSLPW
jgi:hypothetical protein